MAAVVRDKKDTAGEDGARVRDSCLATSLILAIIASVKSGRERMRKEIACLACLTLHLITHSIAISSSLICELGDRG